MENSLFFEKMKKKTPEFETKIASIVEYFKNEPVFNFLEKIKEIFPESEIYLVGGALRDFFLDRKCKDYDFIIRNVKAKELQESLTHLGKVNLVGRVFGVFKFVPADQQERFKKIGFEPFDLALPRREHAYLSGGYRDMKTQSKPDLSVEEDLKRRDFTFNAMALRLDFKTLEPQNLIDPYQGLEDLKSKSIKAVGDPKIRFREDYSRMLRALRLACELGFQIEEKTFEIIKENIANLNERKNKEWIVPRETIAKEMLKAFYNNPVRAFNFYEESGAFKVLIPEINAMKGCPQPLEFHTEGDVFVHTRLSLEKLQSKEYQEIFGSEKPSIQLIMALLFHDIGKPQTLKTPERDGADRIRFNEHDEIGGKMAQKIIKRLKLESQPQGSSLHLEMEKINWLVKAHLLLLHGKPEEMRTSTIEKYFFNPLKPGDELIRLSYCDAQATIPESGKPDMENFNAMMARIKEVSKFLNERRALPPPLLDGHEIMKILEIKSGPRVGKIINTLREKQLEGKLKTKEEAIEFIKNTTEIIAND